MEGLISIIKNTKLVFIVIFLSFLTFIFAFDFALVLDDWYQLWGALYNNSALDHYLKWHPNSALEFIIFSKIFGFNHFYWQFVGFLLKIIDSLIIALPVLEITKSRKAAFYTAIFYAASAAGMESFTRVSAHYTGLLIPLLSLSLYFWIRSLNSKSFTTYFISIFFLVFSILSDSGPGFALIPILIIYDLLTLSQKPSKQNTVFSLVRILFLISVAFAVSFLTAKRAAYISNSVKVSLDFIMQNSLTSVQNFLNAIGHLFVGWVVPIKEKTSLADPTFIGSFTGWLFVIFNLIIFYQFVRTKKDVYRNLIIFSFWIPVFYLPSWLASQHLVSGSNMVGVTHRYLTIPNVGLAAILGYMASGIKNNVSRSLFITVVIFLNILNINIIMNNESNFRSQSVQNKLFGKIDRDVPLGNLKNSIFVYLGDSWLKIVGLDWNGAFPLAVRRGITDTNDFPVVTSDVKLIEKLICGKTDMQSVGVGVGMEISLKNKHFSLENLYAWKINDNTGELQNVSDQIRKILSDNINC